MQKTMTITLDEVVYDGLINMIGREKISQFIENLARPYVEKDSLTDAYRAMAADTEREKEASEWSNGLIGDIANEAW
jgi:hypothetical protein